MLFKEAADARILMRMIPLTGRIFIGDINPKLGEEPSKLTIISLFDGLKKKILNISKTYL